MNNLEEACREAVARWGVARKACYFAWAAGGEMAIHRLKEITRLPTARIEQLLHDFLSERYASFSERRRHGLETDVEPMPFCLSQGYKRGLQWRDVPVGKTCYDICIYQQLLQELRPRTIIEFGTAFGGSALFYADHARMFGLNAKVITLDRSEKHVDEKVKKDEDIEFIAGDVERVVDLLPLDRLRSLPHPWLVIEDCHKHVPLIVGHLHPVMEEGDYLCIEDIPLWPEGSIVVHQALRGVAPGSLVVDTFYTDMFGRNATCSPDAIFRKVGGPEKQPP
jgi:cephalosporin hydroxylase